MAFQYLNNWPLDEARGQYLALLREAGFAPRRERIPVQAARGRITAGAVYAHICAPHYPACAMDGIAVCAADTFGASDTTPISLLPEQYTVVDTGDPLPEDRDAVIMVEEVVFAEGRAVIRQAAVPWQHDWGGYLRRGNAVGWPYAHLPRRHGGHDRRRRAGGGGAGKAAHRPDPHRG